jgi:hypothetical protein
MPALPPVPNVMKVTLSFHMSTDLDVIVRFFLGFTGGGSTNTVLTAFAGQIHSAWMSEFGNSMAGTTSLTQVEVVDLTSSTAGIGIDTTVSTGTSPGTELAAGTAFLLNFQVQRRYRGGKPRAYLPLGTSTNVLDAQHWNTGFPPAVVTAWNGFIAALQAAAPAGSSALNQVSVSYYKGFTVFTGSTGRAHNVSTPRPTPVVDAIIGHSGNPRFASQRRRNRP